MIDNPLQTIFGFIGPFYGLYLPLLIITILAILFLASMQESGAKAKGVSEAIYCFAMHAVAVLLMTIGALPTVFSVFAGVAYTARTYVALLLVFACGGILFLIQDQLTRHLHKPSSAVIEAIYMSTLKIIGTVLSLLSALSIVLSIVLGSLEPGWWVTPFVLLLYGLLLTWCTREEGGASVFETAPMTLKQAKPAKAAAPKKSARKRKK